MNNREVEELFGEWATQDTMDDAHQAQYDYDGQVPQDEDIADWHKIKRIGAVKL